MNPNAPILLGIGGEAGTGKTSLADILAPPGRATSSGRQINKDGEVVEDSSPIYWSHLYFAIPLYRMAAARQKIQGEDAFDRQCYELHDILTDLFKGYISYDEQVDFVYELAMIPVPPEGKPRKFLQDAGTMCRAFDPDCFVKWVDRKAKEEHQLFTQEQERLEETDPDYVPKVFGVVVSDIRYLNELELFRTHTNGVAVKLVTDPEVVTERLQNRDGVTLNPGEAKHSSETTLRTIPEDMWDAIIDTSYLTLKDVYEHITKVLANCLR